MGLQYAGSEVLKIAVEIERKGKIFYEDMAELITHPKVKEIFQFLAKEEVRHEVIFTKMLSSIEPQTEKSVFDDDELSLFYRSLVGDKVFPSKSVEKELKNDFSDLATALQRALDLEKDAILFFHEMKTITSEKDHAVIEEIIQEERDHIKKILEIMKEYL